MSCRPLVGPLAFICKGPRGGGPSARVVRQQWASFSCLTPTSAARLCLVAVDSSFPLQRDTGTTRALASGNLQVDR